MHIKINVYAREIHPQFNLFYNQKQTSNCEMWDCSHRKISCIGI
jgi:hypothetical protein